MAAERRRQRDPHGEDLRYADQEFTKTPKFLHRFGPVQFQGRRILDFGCRFGGSTWWYAVHGAGRVIGVDQCQDSLTIARDFIQNKLAVATALAEERQAGERIEFRHGGPRTIPLEAQSVDLIVSEDVVEHLEDPEAILREWWRVLVPGGRVLVSFGPLWYHPHGVHLWEIFPGPWTHLLFPERTCVFVRNLLKADGKNGTRWTELNQMTMTRFEQLVYRSPFRTVLFRGHAMFGLQPLLLVPGLRELFISQVDCILAKD